MSICPNCEYEYLKGITICPDCGAALVDEKHFQKPPELSESDWEVVFTSNQDYEVEMFRDNLEAAGIGVTILSQKDRNFPVTGDFSVIKLLVKKTDVKDALNYIMKVKNEDTSSEED